ncbi:MAG: hypothetical protein Q8N94_11540 [Methanoregula sp.]|nr:hypothetical protein [Methanoregula sp.]
MVRLHYLDNLRRMSILLLFPVHAAVVFSAGWFGYFVTSDHTFPVALWIIVTIMPWLMPLLSGSSFMFSVLLTFACYEVLRRIPVVRALFGIAGPQKK